MPLDPNSPHQVAVAIADMSDQLEARTAEYAVDIEQAARSSSAYKLAWSQAMMDIINRSTSRMTVAEREARVEILTNDQRVIAEIHEAKAKATKEALNSLRVRLDACRSLGANLRAQT